MGKSIFDPDVVDELSQRVSLLKGNELPKWGKMSPTEMLRHCNLANQKTLTWRGELRKPTLKQLLVKWTALYLFPGFPKNAKTSPRFETKGLVASEEFETEKALFLNLLSQFANLDEPLSAPHPFFGPLSNREWGIAVWKHMDHHLRQFGH
ncbi:DUF1569 domain-containing protein [Pleomorphovibrio marinus]|uniref:DUF1569 domain-containing protein n=1 Tax=Pleomorphovibrio marinus TaxID=2164132 RepID=UPI001300BC2D|nr:DUF1569 domain-containing protein [Pleomorphovibrio marinus]